MIGRTIAHYQVTDRLGAGGMGEVYRARDSKLGRDVALKVLPEAFARDPDRLMRFEREARLLASLNHANLAVIHGIEQDGERRVLVLELIEGEDLSKRIARGAIPVDEALRIARQVADAVESAHEQGVVHRDLKPGNIVVNADGVVKVLDFGLAKALESDASPASGLSQSPTIMASSPTAAGVILGTAAYMSPEQARGRKVDRRADIFAFGCVLFEMLAGRQAFAGDTVSDTLAAILRAEPDWSALPADTPRAIRRLLERCLEKDPKQRLRDIGEARIVLDAVARGATEEAPVPAAAAPAGRARAWLPWTVAGVAVAAAVVTAFLPRGSRVAPPPMMDLAIPLPGNSALALRGQHPAPPAISPDGRRVVFGITQQGSTILCARKIDSRDAITIPGTDGAGYPFWSPDGRQIAFFAQGKLKRVDAGGGPVTVICDAPLGKGGSWGPDGTIVFAPNYASGIMRVASDGGEPQVVTAPDTTRGEVSHRFPRLLPDGKRFLYVTRSVSARSAGQGVAGVRLRVGSLDGSPDREIMAAESNALYADGCLLFVRNGFLVAQAFDPGTQALSGEPVPLAGNLRVISGASYGIFDASATGLLLFQSGSTVEGNSLRWVDLAGQEVGRLGEPAQINDPIRISPDGKYVCAAIFDARIGTPDVWIWDLERGLRTRFTTDTAADNNPVWSPDGSRAVFSSSRRGHVDLFVKNVGGSAPETMLHSGKGDSFALAWSPDGREVLAAQLITGGGWTCVAIPTGGAGEAREVMTVITGFGASFSPSGRWLAYDTADGGNRDTFVMSYRGAGRKWQISSAGGFNPRWVGSHIYYFNERNLVRTTVTEGDSTISIGSEEVLFPVSDLVDYDVSPDETRILLLQELDAGNRAPLSLVLNWTQKLRAAE